MSVFGDRLRVLRKTVSQAEFARKLGENQQTYARWENGDREPELEKVKILANQLGVTTDYLLGLTGASQTVDQLKSASAPSETTRITANDVSKLIEENCELAKAARDLGEAHKQLINTNAELSKELVELCRESRHQKDCTPVNAHSGGGRAAKTASG